MKDNGSAIEIYDATVQLCESLGLSLSLIRVYAGVNCFDGKQWVYPNSEMFQKKELMLRRFAESLLNDHSFFFSFLEFDSINDAKALGYDFPLLPAIRLANVYHQWRDAFEVVPTFDFSVFTREPIEGTYSNIKTQAIKVCAKCQQKQGQEASPICYVEKLAWSYLRRD